MSKVIKTIEGKIKYYEGMERKMMRTYIADTKKASRDGAIRCGERVAAYTEILELLKEGDK